MLITAARQLTKITARRHAGGGMATAQGFAPAPFNLGYLYAEGLGVTQNSEEAIRLYRMAADQDHVPAQNH